MKKKSFIKRIVVVALSMIMVWGSMPMAVFADGTYTFPSNSQSGNNNSTLRYYLTDENAGDVNITQESGYVQLRLILDEGWYFDKWETYFNGYEDVAVISDPEVKGSNPKSDEGVYTFFNRNGEYSPFVNDSGLRNILINIAKATGFYGDHSVTAVLKPIVTVNAGDGVSYQVATNDPSYTHLAANQVAVKYRDNATITYTIDNKYIVTNVSANYGTNYSDNGTAVTVNSIIKPATVNINTRLKQQNVNFDANGGSGTMSAQVFEHSVAQTLAENNFTKVGYTFAGWNTLANGDGISYTDKQSVTFTPANDGDSITLYAQWTACTNHNWVTGKCTECGALCSHSGGNATCIEQAVCAICGEKYGDLAKHNIVYNGSDNVITETCTAGCGHSATATIEQNTTLPTVYTGSAIETLKVSYSDGWQGGSLVITYANNTDVGTASGTIEKGEATATATFEIMAADMTGVSAVGYSGTYDGEAHSITVTAPADVTITYKTGNGEYSTANPTFKDAGTYTVEYKVTMANHKDCTGSANVVINKVNLTVTANDASKTYGENDPTLTWSITSGSMVDAEQLTGITVSRVTGEDVNTYQITASQADGANKNYNITFADGTFAIDHKEIGISWSDTIITYDGTAQTPAATATGTAFDDQLTLAVDSAKVDAGSYTATVTGITGDKAANYKLPSNVATAFTIENASQTAPVVTSVNETIYGKADGKITGVDSAMEYRKDDESTYTVISRTEQTGLAAGKYYVRNAAKTNYNASADTEVVIGAGRKLTVTLPAEQVGYELEISATELDWHSGAILTLTLANGYSKTGEFEVSATRATLSDNGDGTYIISNAEDNVVIAVSGVADLTAPTLYGVENNGVYYGDKIIKAIDDNFLKIEVDGVNVTNTTVGDNEYKIVADNAEHTVTVTDKAGNVTEYKIVVYKIYTVNFVVDGEIYSTAQVNHGADATLPEIPAKTGYTASWNKDGKNIMGNTDITAVYTAITAADSPQTGDNTQMWLWWLLLIASATGIAIIGVEQKKRKTMK